MWNWFASETNDESESDNVSDVSSVVSYYSCSTCSESSFDSFDESIKSFHRVLKKSIRWDDECQGRDDEIELAKSDPTLKAFIDMVSDAQKAIRTNDDKQIRIEMEKLIRVVLSDKNMMKHTTSAHYISLMKEYEDYNLRKSIESECPAADYTDDSDDNSVSSFPAVS